MLCQPKKKIKEKLFTNTNPPNVDESIYWKVSDVRSSKLAAYHIVHVLVLIDFNLSFPSSTSIRAIWDQFSLSL